MAVLLRTRAAPAAPATLALAAATVLAVLTGDAAASSVYLAQKCRGGTCTDPKFPILDFDQERGECVCRAHPCWDNEGVEHQCSESSGFPFLHFSYSVDQRLTCTCSSVPQYDSIHVSKDHCPGETCDSADFPILDWEPREQKCFCRAHPCWDQHGSKHVCTDPKHPILHYREDKDADGAGRPKCECVTKFVKPVSALRGKRAQQSFSRCTFADYSNKF